MTRNEVLLIVLILEVVLTTLFLALGIWFYLKDRRIKKKSDNRTLGKVIGYSWSQSRAPIVEYEVNRKKYKTALRYSLVITTSSSFNPVRSKVKGDLLDTKLRISNNSVMSVNTIMQESFPIGSKMNVYYNPDKPKESFVERFAPSYLGRIFIIGSLVPIISAVSLIVLF